MKFLSLVIFMAVIVSAFLVAGCSQSSGNNSTSSISTTAPTTLPPSTVSPTTSTITWSELKQGIAAGKEIAEKIVSLIPEINVWLPSQPVTGGESVRLLTQDEKDKILQIANAFEPVKEAQQNQEVLSLDTRDYFWKSSTSEDTVTVSNTYLEKRGINEKLIEYMGNQCYPGVFLLFHTQYDKYAYAGMNIVVNLEQEKVIYVEGFIKDADFMPDEPSNVNPESATLAYLDNTLSPLNPNYDPSDIYGGEGTRFGPPWARGPNITVTPPSSPSPTPGLAVNPTETSPENPVIRTIPVNQPVTVNGITITLDQVVITTTGFNINVLYVPAGYDPSGGMPSTIPGAQAEYSLDNGPTMELVSPPPFSLTEKGIGYSWISSDLIPGGTKELTIRITSLGKQTGPWEFKVPLN
jgi:hypothetical protein